VTCRHLLVHKPVCFILLLKFFLFSSLLFAAFAVPRPIRFGSGVAKMVSVGEAFYITWAWACPESRHTVIGSRRENVAQRVPIE